MWRSRCQKILKITVDFSISWHIIIESKELKTYDKKIIGLFLEINESLRNGVFNNTNYYISVACDSS